MRSPRGPAAGRRDSGRSERAPGGSWLDGELAAVRAEMTRVDSKCGALTAIATAASGFSVTQAGHGPLAAPRGPGGGGGGVRRCRASDACRASGRPGGVGTCRCPPLTDRAGASPSFRSAQPGEGRSEVLIRDVPSSHAARTRTDFSALTCT